MLAPNIDWYRVVHSQCIVDAGWFVTVVTTDYIELAMR